MNAKQALQLKELLETVHKKFVENNEVQNDAIAPALKYKNHRDKEFSAFLCAVLAYGKVAHIKASVEKILVPMGDFPTKWLTVATDEDLLRVTKNWSHRFNTSKDMFLFLSLMQNIYSQNDSLEEFINPKSNDDAFVILEKLHQNIQALSVKNRLRLPPKKNSFWFLLPHPKSGSACKRLNLFLRWMVGRSEMDLSLWKSVKPSQLIIPVDTHILKQSRLLKLTTRSTADWKTALEITQNLKCLDPNDPTRFDFAICHLGINGISIGAGRRQIILKQS